MNYFIGFCFIILALLTAYYIRKVDLKNSELSEENKRLLKEISSLKTNKNEEYFNMFIREREKNIHLTKESNQMVFKIRKLETKIENLKIENNSLTLKLRKEIYPSERG